MSSRFQTQNKILIDTSTMNNITNANGFGLDSPKQYE